MQPMGRFLAHEKNMQQLSDDALLAAIGNGDKSAGATFIRRHLPYVLKICRTKLGTTAEAEEAAQDVFAAVWKNAGNWQTGNAKVTTWLYRIAGNRCIDIIRKRRPMTDIEQIAEPGDDRVDIEAAQQIADRHRLITQALEALNDDQRRAIELVYYGEVKQGEAAELMGITLAALESILRRARAKLHSELAGLHEHLQAL